MTRRHDARPGEHPPDQHPLDPDAAAPQRLAALPGIGADRAAGFIAGLQRGVGNAAVTRWLATARPPLAREPTTPLPAWGDPVKGDDESDTERDAPPAHAGEHDDVHGGAEQVLTMRASVGNRAVTQYLARAGGAPAKQPGDKEAERRQRAKEAHEAAVALNADAGRASKELKAEILVANDDLDYVERLLKRYINSYNRAYGRFSAALANAKRGAEEERARGQIIAGIIVGTGLGLAAGAIFHAAKGAAKVVAEAATEAAEALAGKASEAAAPSTGVFKPPASFDPQLFSTPALAALMDAWRGLARFNDTTHAFGEYRLSVQQLAFELERRPTDEMVGKVREMVSHDALGAFRAKMSALHQSVAEFKATSEHPNLNRTDMELEQDMWVRWLSALPGDVDERQSAIAAVRRDLKLAGVTGELSDLNRLGFKWGRVTTGHDYYNIEKGAIDEGRRMDEIGRYGVASDDFSSVLFGGMVTLRDDLDAKLGKKAPASKGLNIHKPYRAWPRRDEEIKARQIVRVIGTTPSGLEVQPALDQSGRPAFV